MIIDLAKKYSPHLLHWPTWIIEEAAFDAFLQENRLEKQVSNEIDQAMAIRREISNRSLVVPNEVLGLLEEALSPQKTYELRMPSPLRLARITNFRDLEIGLKEFWLDMYFGNPEKSKELKLYETLPKTIYESHRTQNGAISPMAKLNYFPVRFESFIYNNNYYVREIVPLTELPEEKLLSEAPMSLDAQSKVTGISLCPGFAKGQWVPFGQPKKPVRGKIVVAGKLSDKNLGHLLLAHPKAIVLTKIPDRGQLPILKRRGIPAIYVSPDTLDLQENRPVTIDGEHGTISY